MNSVPARKASGTWQLITSSVVIECAPAEAWGRVVSATLFTLWPSGTGLPILEFIAQGCQFSQLMPMNEHQYYRGFSTMLRGIVVWKRSKFIWWLSVAEITPQGCE
jgi:hypothetical protein